MNAFRLRALTYLVPMVLAGALRRAHSTLDRRLPSLCFVVNKFATSRWQCFATSSDDHDAVNAITSFEYESRSTSDPDMAAKYYEGSEERRARLHKELHAIGLDIEILLQSAKFRGSAAARTYNSFVLPKSEGALAMAEQPQRAAVIANSISFLIREHRSHMEDWLQNHDRSLQEVESKMDGPRHPITLVLDDIRSAHNVGNIIRFAEAARCEKVLLCGSMTPSPPHPKVLKTALGSAEYVPYETSGSALQAIRKLKTEDVQVYAVETTDRSLPLWKVSFFAGSGDAEKNARIPQIAFVFGNELVGVGVNVLKECDAIISVPTHGIKNSLNVATCASVVTWEALRQYEMIHEDGGC